MADEIKAGEDKVVWEKPDEWPDQFADPQAVLKSYEESRREMDRLRSQMETERQQFSAALEQIEARQPTPPVTPTDPNLDPMVAAYTRAYEEGDTARMMQLSADFAAKQMLDPISRVLDERLSELKPTLEAQTQATRESQIRMAEDIVARQLGPEEYRLLVPAISTILQEHPHYLPTAGSVEAYADSILQAAKLAQHDTLTKTVAQLEAERQEKLAAQTVQGAGRGSVYSKSEQEEMRDRIKNAPGDSYAAMMARNGA